MPHPLVQPTGHWMRDVISDEEVVARVVSGEPELFELLIRRHNQRLYRVVRAQVRDDSEAEDVLQMTHVSAWQALPQFEGRSKYLTWVTRIAIRKAEAIASKRARIEKSEGIAAETRKRAIGLVSADVDQSDLRRLLERSICSLPRIYRSVFVLREVEGMAISAVAHDLELSESAVKVRLMRARTKLRAQLEAQGRDDDCVRSLWRFDGEHCDRITSRSLAVIRTLTAM